MAELIKHVSRNRWVQAAIIAAAAALIRLVKRSTRWQTVGAATAQPAWDGSRPMIVAFWHNRLAMMPYCWPSTRPFHMLISSHPDGRLIADTVRHFGISTVVGSSRRGGGEALRGAGTPGPCRTAPASALPPMDRVGADAGQRRRPDSGAARPACYRAGGGFRQPPHRPQDLGPA